MADELLCQPSDVIVAFPKFGKLPDPEQTALIACASQKILNFCRRPGFLQASVTEVHNGRNCTTLYLRRRPVISVQSIVINGEAPLDNSDGNAWAFDGAMGKLFRGSGRDDPRFGWWFPQGFQNITVQYWAGYAAIPDPVVRATIFLVQYLYEINRVSFVFKTESIGDYSYELNQAAMFMTLPEVCADLLAEYVQDDGPL